MKGAILLFLVFALAYVCASPAPESYAAKGNKPQGVYVLCKFNNLIVGHRPRRVYNGEAS